MSPLRRLGLGGRAAGWPPSASIKLAEALEVLAPDAPVAAEFLGRQRPALDLSPYHGLRHAQFGGSFLGPHPVLRHDASLPIRQP